MSCGHFERDQFAVVKKQCTRITQLVLVKTKDMKKERVISNLLREQVYSRLF